MKLIDGDKLERHLDYLIQKEKQLAKECSLSPNNEFERQRRYCFEANALAYELCKNVMDYYLVTDAQVMDQWISVNDKLPEQDEKVLVLTKDKDIMTMIYKVTPFRWYKPKFGGFDKDYATHWKPLPELPKEGDTE